jgi:hypothetical protein
VTSGGDVSHNLITCYVSNQRRNVPEVQRSNGFFIDAQHKPNTSDNLVCGLKPTSRGRSQVKDIVPTSQELVFLNDLEKLERGSTTKTSRFREAVEVILLPLP